MWFHWSPIPLVCAHLTVSLTHRKLFNSSIFLNCIVLHILENVHHTYGFAPQPTALLISLHTHTIMPPPPPRCRTATAIDDENEDRTKNVNETHFIFIINFIGYAPLKFESMWLKQHHVAVGQSKKKKHYTFPSRMKKFQIQIANVNKKNKKRSSNVLSLLFSHTLESHKYLISFLPY